MLRDTKIVDTIKPFPFCEDGAKELTFELPAADFQCLVKDTIEIYNLIAELLRDHKVLQPKELAKMTMDNMHGLQAEAELPLRSLLAQSQTISIHLL